MSAGGAINLAAYSVAIPRLPATTWAPLLAVVFGTGCGLVFNFLSAKYWVFRKKS